MSRPIVEVKALEFGYRPGRPMFRDLSVEIPAGTFVGIVGPNGSGKTTLLRILAGLVRPWSGQVLLDGRQLRGYRPGQLAKVVAMVGQGSEVPVGFTVAEAVLISRVAQGRRRVFCARSDLELACEAMRMTQTLDLADRRLDQISGGERQRVLLARAFAQGAKVVMLDEPTAFMDLRHRVQAYQLLKAAQLGQGRTVVVVTHDLTLADRYCDRVLLLRPRPDVVEVIAGRPDEVLTCGQLGGAFGLRLACGTVSGQRVFAPEAPQQPPGPAWRS